jgi:uncharacterized membrane protein YidH (DUF202 family)
LAVTARRLIATGSALTALGLAIAGMAPVVGTAAEGPIRVQQSIGGWVVLFGWAVLAWGIHRFGRG